jgi:PTS system ascorbate-specific IIB component
MKIYCVCGAGLGTSVILARNTERVLRDLGIEAEVSAVPLSELSRLPLAQLILATKDVALALDRAGSEVVALNSPLDLAELRAAITHSLS